MLERPLFFVTDMNVETKEGKFARFKIILPIIKSNKTGL
jgi:hypothetical protein